MRENLQRKPFKFGLHFILGAIVVCCSILLHPVSGSFAASSETVGNAYSALSITMIVVGVIVFGIYLKSMLTVLQEAASSYTEMEEDSDHISYYSSPAWGAAIAGLIAALVIGLYGIDPIFLYLGPILCMISPMAVIYCMSRDIREFKTTHSGSSVEIQEPLTRAIDR
ncbi:MAG: hypothetical protein AAFW84_35390 [Cyanobacteria bacterium J06635_15]